MPNIFIQITCICVEKERTPTRTKARIRVNNYYTYPTDKSQLLFQQRIIFAPTCVGYNIYALVRFYIIVYNNKCNSIFTINLRTEFIQNLKIEIVDG